MKKFFIVFLMSLLIIPVSAYSYDNKVIVVRDGVSGIWFDEPTATKMLEDLTELNILRTNKIPTLETDLQLHKKQIEIYALELTVTEQISEKYETSLSRCEEVREKEFAEYQQVLKHEDKWYKSRTLVFILGIFTGGLLSVGLVFGLQGVK